MNINLDQLIIHSWEGGHPDHDTSHVIGFKLVKKLDLLDRTFQFPLYSGNKLYWYFFRLFDTSITKGDILVYKIPNLKKFKYLYLISYYKSQVKTFIGLFPIYLMHIIFSKYFKLQKLSKIYYFKKPHSGELLYERRKMGDFEKLQKIYVQFLNSI